MRLPITLFAAMAMAASCSYAVSDIASVPPAPTYERDVKPLFADHCLLCHSSPPSRGAPKTLRLDAYDDVDGVFGARSMAGAAVARVEAKQMPPAAENGDGVGPNGLQMLKKWLENQAPR